MAPRLIEALTAKPNGEPKRLAPEVLAKLQTAEQRLADLERQADELALAGVLEQPGAREKLTAHEKQTRAVRNEVERLRSAHRLAVRKDSASDARARMKLQRSQFAAMQAHAMARHRAFAEMARGIEIAARA